MKQIFKEVPTFKGIPRLENVAIFDMCEIIEGRRENDQQIINYLMDYKSKNSSEMESNVQAWQTSWDTYENHPICHGLVKDIFSLLLQPINFKSLVLTDYESISEHASQVFDNSKLNNCWFACCESGDSVREHDHGFGVLSFCYYLHMEEQSSPIYFTSNKGSQLSGIADEAGIPVYARSGQLVVFKSELPHEVPPTKGRRINFSGNISFDFSSRKGNSITEIMTKQVINGVN